jgi:hypothetical protein
VRGFYFFDALVRNAPPQRHESLQSLHKHIPHFEGIPDLAPPSEHAECVSVGMYKQQPAGIKQLPNLVLQLTS